MYKLKLDDIAAPSTLHDFQLLRLCSLSPSQPSSFVHAFLGSLSRLSQLLNWLVSSVPTILQLSPGTGKLGAFLCTKRAPATCLSSIIRSMGSCLKAAPLPRSTGVQTPVADGRENSYWITAMLPFVRMLPCTWLVDVISGTSCSRDFLKLCHAARPIQGSARIAGLLASSGKSPDGIIKWNPWMMLTFSVVCAS